MFPPHLPPPSSSLRLHRFSKRFIFCLTILFLGVIAGGSGAAMMLGWIWPVVGVGEMGINSFSRPTIHSPVDETIRKETLDKMVTVYRAPTMVGEVSLLNPADRLGEAVALSSEGWFVMHAKEGDDANNKNLRVVTPSGVIYLVEKVFFDRYGGFLYFKISGLMQGVHLFKPVEFAQNTEIGDDFFWVRDDSWLPATVERIRPFSELDEHLDSISPHIYFSNRTNGPSFDGLAMNASGKLVGFFTSDGELIPATRFIQSVSTVLSQGVVNYRSLGVMGWYSAETPFWTENSNPNGFLVTKVLAKNSVLKRGDVLVEVNGDVADFDHVWYHLNHGNELNVKILRNKKLLQFLVPIIDLKM